MRCGNCGHEFVVQSIWMDRWEQGEEECLGCNLTCEHENAPRVTVDPKDSALDDDRVAQFFWYHTSTHPDWPAKNIEPADPKTSWDEQVAARQRGNALHVGTYEASVQIMLRRISDQVDQGRQFYMYRVRLKASVTVREGWIPDPSNWVGDVVLDEVCPEGVDVTRYLNYHEDPGGISLALRRDAVADVQQVAIPLPEPLDGDWVREAAATLERVSAAPVTPTGKLGRFMQPSSPRTALARKLAEDLARSLPHNLRHQFEVAASFHEGTDPAPWARGTSCTFDLIAEPSRVLVALDGAEYRAV